MSRNREKGQAVNILFTMLLFLVFVLSALFTVLIGGKVYENINTRMNENFTGSTALSYIANKVRQGDSAGMVSVQEIEGQPVLQLAQEINGEQYVTWIYHYEGEIRELFTDVNSGLTLQDGMPILECGGLKLSQTGRLLHVETTGTGGGSIVLSIRSGGQFDE